LLARALEVAKDKQNHKLLITFEINTRIQIVTDDDLLKIICDFFIESHDFNGILARGLAEAANIDWADLKLRLIRLLEDRLIDNVREPT